MTAQNNCDGSGPHSPGIVKLYPIGDGNLILCLRCWANENRFNFNRGVETKCPDNFRQHDWNKAETYGQDRINDA